MATYLLAQLKLRYGRANLARYEEAMKVVRTLFEAQNVMLVTGTVTRVGPLYEAWNLWKVEDQGHMERAFAGMASVAGRTPEKTAEAMAALKELDETVESETVRLVEGLSFSPEA